MHYTRVKQVVDKSLFTFQNEVISAGKSNNFMLVCMCKLRFTTAFVTFAKLIVPFEE